MKAIDLGWVCGFLEGEACFSCYKYKSTRGYVDYTILLRVIQVDKTVLNRLYKIVGVGKIRPHKIYNKISKQPQFEWTVSRREELRQILSLIRQHLSKRRQNKIDAMLKILNRPIV